MNPTSPPARANRGDLLAALTTVLSEHFGAPRAVRAMERRPAAYSSSYALEELDVTLEDGTRLELLFKDLSPSALTAEARWVKPDFLYDARREIAVYRTVLSGMPLGTATCYGARASRRLKRYWLFLERVRGMALWQVGDLDVWQDAARWLARMHRGLQQRAAASPARTLWIRYDAAFYQRWLRRAVQHVRRRDPASQAAFRVVVDRSGVWMRRLAALPAAFLHGEFYPSNVLVQRASGHLRICPVDWETAAVGPALMDLGALTSGTWTRDEQQAMVAAYLEARRRAREEDVPDLETAMQGVAACQLFQAVQWLGWSLRWEPPPEHASNWLERAVTLAEQLTG